MYKLTVADGATLRGFWISKETLKKIDASVKAESGQPAVGYSVYFGKQEDYNKNRAQVLNLVVRGNISGAGARATNMKLLGTFESEIVDAGDYYDTFDPCPSHCGTPPLP